MMKKKELEIFLENFKPLEKPKASFEQYTIPAYLAAEILHTALLNGDLKGKVVADFGCGSGRLALGAAILGASSVVAIDIDEEAIQQAKKNLKMAEEMLGKKLRIEFFCSDVANWSKKCDTVLQNPPFGIRSEHSDTLFLEKAICCANRIYSLHRNGRETTRKFLVRFITSKGGKIECIKKLKFFLPHTFKFHRKPKLYYDVDLYVITSNAGREI
ncbi:MAG: METTL5 family protein [Candidatus Aenigmatarchaeota archaeon]